MGDHNATNGHASHGHVKNEQGCCGGHGGGCCGGKAQNGERRHEGVVSTGCCEAEVSLPTTVEDLERLATPELIARYRRGVENYDRRVFMLTESLMDTAFLPEGGVGQWPVRVLLGHIADAELVLVSRMRRVVGEDRPMLQNWDENAFIDANVYGLTDGTRRGDAETERSRVSQALGGFIAVVHTLRQWHGMWLMSLPAEAFSRVGLHEQRGEQSLKRILAYATWHLEHHARFLGLKLDRLVGSEILRREEPVAGGAAAAGGAKKESCGPGCGCARG